MRYAVYGHHGNHVDHILPRKNADRMKITTRRRKIEIKIEKITLPKGKREKKFKSGKEATGRKQEVKKRNTQENPQIFADCRLARFARGVEQRQAFALHR